MGGGLPSLGGLPALGGAGRKPFMMGGIHGRAGGFDVDENMKRQVEADLRKLNGGFEEINIEEEKKDE